jgi:threonylcarbamoyladenosine tRNA methylthiotransferase MtaB
MATPKSVAFHTLGCKLNFAETSTIRRRFENLGFITAHWDEPADIYVLNTCSVTEFADRKCRSAVRKALRQQPDARIVVIGCYAQLKPEEISKIDGVDLVLGAAEKFNVHSYVESLGTTADKGMIRACEIKEIDSFEGAFSYGDRTRSFLKIQDGCNYNCSFCTIPLARGKSRSSKIDQVVDNAKRIADLGVREIVLTGVNIGDFGLNPSMRQKKTSRKEDFLGLIQALDQVNGIDRFRISSIEPNLCSDQIIDFVSSSDKFVPHFHMPLQSGSNAILKMMRRRYRKELYRDRVDRIKTWMPHACIGVDVIVGFPGECNDLFNETATFLADLDVSYLHVFTYSERQNTLAATFSERVPMNERRMRNQILRQLSTKKKQAFYRNHMGQVRPVLLEEDKRPGYLSGFTDNYIKVEVLAEEGNLVNKICDVHLDSIGNDVVVRGEIAKELA